MDGRTKGKTVNRGRGKVTKGNKYRRGSSDATTLASLIVSLISFDDFLRSKTAKFEKKPVDRRTDRRTLPLREMRSRI